MIHERHQEWLNLRGNLSDMADAMEVQTVDRHGGKWLCFPYRLKGEIVNRKYRLTSDKRHEMDKGGKLCLWNAECLSDEPNEVIITEGEFDALAAMRCGFHAVVSVPNGAPAEAVDDPVNSNRYAFMWESENELKRVKSFVLATDSDKPGRILAKDLAAILGPERCKFVEYPEGCKDLNEVLQKHGQERVTSLITNAKHYPVRGLYRLADFPEETEVQAMSTGISELDEFMMVALGALTVFTGYSNMGKSTVINTILGHCLSKGVPVCIASFETIPRPILERGLIDAVSGGGQFSPAEAREVVHAKLSVITNAMDEEGDIDLEYYLELVRVAVVRDGCRVIVLDPWNELEHKRRRDETETDYIGRAIRALKSFARRHNVSLWVVSHPTKPQKGVNSMPSLYDISGSANWANKADYGLVYHRPDKTKNEGQLAVVKVRMGMPGKCGAFGVKLNNQTGRIEADEFAQ